MTLKEAKQIMGLETGQLTKTRLEERYKALFEANNEEGSLYLRHKITIAKQVLEKHALPENNYRRR